MVISGASGLSQHMGQNSIELNLNRLDWLIKAELILPSLFSGEAFCRQGLSQHQGRGSSVGRIQVGWQTNAGSK